MFFIVLTAITQPYIVSTQTQIDIIFWAFLAYFYISEEAAANQILKPATQMVVAKYLRVLVKALPMLFMLCVVSYWIYKHLKKIITRARASRSGYVPIEEEPELPDRMNNPLDYKERENNNVVIEDNSDHTCDSYLLAILSREL